MICNRVGLRTVAHRGVMRMSVEHTFLLKAILPIGPIAIHGMAHDPIENR